MDGAVDAGPPIWGAPDGRQGHLQKQLHKEQSGVLASPLSLFHNTAAHARLCNNQGGPRLSEINAHGGAVGDTTTQPPNLQHH